MKQAVEDRQPSGRTYCEKTQDRPHHLIHVVDEAESFEPEGQRHKYAQHSLIFMESDPADRIYQLLEGAVMLYKLLPDGRRQVVELIGPGDVFGLGGKPVQDCSAETLLPSVVATYERHAVERSASFMQRLNRCVQAQICALHEHAVLLGRKSALERVATFLMRFVPNRGGYGCTGRQGADDHKVIRLSMTRQEIADYLGLTIETVSRAFSELRRRGVVTVERQDEVKLNDVCGICRLTGAH